MNDLAELSNKTSLKREIGFWLLCFYGLGNILGAGIYVLVGKVAGHAGYYTLLSFCIAGFVAAFTAFSYAELSARFPVAAGAAVYLQEGFNKVWLSVISGLTIAMAGLFSAATIIRGFSGYAQVYVNAPDQVIISIVVLGLVLLAMWGVAESVMVAAILTLLEIIGLVIIITLGFEQIDQLPELINTMPSIFEKQVWVGIFAGAFLAFYAFIGFEDMVNLAEEAKEPEKNMPRAIIFALVISIILYSLVVLSASFILTPEELAKSSAPLADVFQKATSNSPVVITAISLTAVINGALIQIIMATRIFYGMSKRRWLPSWLAYLHPKRRTPIVATLLAGVIIYVLACWIPLLKLASYTSFLILIIFTLINIALIKIKKRHPAPEGVKTYPVYIPIIGVAGSLLLLIVELSFGH